VNVPKNQIFRWKNKDILKFSKSNEKWSSPKMFVITNDVGEKSMMMPEKEKGKVPECI